MILKIKEYRDEFQLTQAELAEKIGSSQKNISNWEKGLHEPDCDSILKLAAFFNISLDELFGREEHAPSVYSEIDFSILKVLQKMSASQKFSLLQFLKEMTSEYSVL